MVFPFALVYNYFSETGTNATEDDNTHIKFDCNCIFHDFIARRLGNLCNTVGDVQDPEVVTQLTLKYLIGAAASRSRYSCFPTDGKPMLVGLCWFVKFSDITEAIPAKSRVFRRAIHLKASLR